MALAALLQADPRVSKIAAQIRAQQKIVAPKGIVIPDEYIDEMASAFVRQFGVSDARDLSATWMDVTQESEGASQSRYQYVFTRKGEALAPDWSNAIGYTWADGPDGSSATVGFGTSYDNRWDYVFRWIPSIGAPIFATIPHADITFWSGFAQWALTAAALAGLPAVIGEAVLGADFAAANPLISEAVGKASLQLTLTGGDPKSLTGLVATATGVQVGDFVGSAVDSAAVGTIAQAATSAAIQGKNAGTAAAKAAFFTLGGSMGDFTEVETTLDDLGLSAEVLAQLDALSNLDPAIGLSGNELFSDPWGSLVTVSGEVAAMSDQEWADSFYVASDGSVRDVTNRVVIPGPEAAAMTPEQITQTIYDQWKAEGGQTVETQPGDSARPANTAQPTAKTKVPSITDQAKTVDALLKTATSIANSIHILSTGRPLPYQTNPYGMNRTTLPGVTITRPDGSTVTNNGNGTQTIRYPDGRVQTTSTSYTGAGSLIPGVTNQALLIGGAILVGAVLLARRK